MLKNENKRCLKNKKKKEKNRQNKQKIYELITIRKKENL